MSSTCDEQEICFNVFTRQLKDDHYRQHNKRAQEIGGEKLKRLAR